MQEERRLLTRPPATVEPTLDLDDVPNPFYVCQREVLNYMGVVELCAMAAKLRSTGSL